MTTAEKSVETKKSNQGHEAGYITKQFLSFFLTKELFAVDIIQVKEIIESNNVTRVPMMPKYIEGVINLRGNVVPVVNLALRFGRKKDIQGKTSSIVIVDLQTDEGLINIGMLVDAVDEVVNIPVADVERAPDFGTKIKSSFLSGIGKIDGKFIMLLNIETVLNIEELSSLDQVYESTGDTRTKQKNKQKIEK